MWPVLGDTAAAAGKAWLGSTADGSHQHAQTGLNSGFYKQFLPAEVILQLPLETAINT